LLNRQSFEHQSNGTDRNQLRNASLDFVSTELAYRPVPAVARNARQIALALPVA